ncbi:hypothetical protein SEA_EVAA_57 [Gordonia phage Evaa]|nr:hypothetical protein SEA_EVAA_57 [Gordonia phage Evaa]
MSGTVPGMCLPAAARDDLRAGLADAARGSFSTLIAVPAMGLRALGVLAVRAAAGPLVRDLSIATSPAYPTTPTEIGGER